MDLVGSLTGTIGTTWLVGLAVVLASVVLLIQRKLHAATFNLSMASDQPGAVRILERTVPEWGELHTVPRKDGSQISMVLARSKGNTHLMVYSHGNGGSLVSNNSGAYYVQERCKLLASLGVDVLCYDYSGFGASEGERTEARWHADCAFVFDYVESQLGYPRKRILPVGQSIGTGVTVRYLAAEHGYAGVVLFHPFKSIGMTKAESLFRSLLSGIDLFQSHRHIHLVEGPALVVHADTDPTVPFSHGVSIKEVLDAAGQLFRFVDLKVTSPADAHGALFTVAPYRQQIIEELEAFLQYLKDRESMGAVAAHEQACVEKEERDALRLSNPGKKRPVKRVRAGYGRKSEQLRAPASKPIIESREF